MLGYENFLIVLLYILILNFFFTKISYLKDQIERTSFTFSGQGILINKQRHRQFLRD